MKNELKTLKYCKDKEEFEELFVDKLYLCAWCDKLIATKKNGRIKWVNWDGRGKKITNENFCNEKHKRNYLALMNGFERIEKRLTLLEGELK